MHFCVLWLWKLISSTLKITFFSSRKLPIYSISEQSIVTVHLMVYLFFFSSFSYFFFFPSYHFFDDMTHKHGLLRQKSLNSLSFSFSLFHFSLSYCLPFVSSRFAAFLYIFGWNSTLSSSSFLLFWESKHITHLLLFPIYAYFLVCGMVGMNSSLLYVPLSFQFWIWFCAKRGNRKKTVRFFWYWKISFAGKNSVRVLVFSVLFHFYTRNWKVHFFKVLIQWIDQRGMKILPSFWMIIFFYSSKDLKL